MTYCQGLASVVRRPSFFNIFFSGTTGPILGKFIISVDIYIQTKYVVMMTKEGSTKIVNFMNPRAGVFCTNAWQNKSYTTNGLFLLKSSPLLPGINQTN